VIKEEKEWKRKGASRQKGKTTGRKKEKEGKVERVKGKRKKQISHYRHQTTIVLRVPDRCLPMWRHASSLPGGNFFIRAGKKLHSGPLHPLLACWRLRPFLHGD